MIHCPSAFVHLFMLHAFQSTRDSNLSGPLPTTACGRRSSAERSGMTEVALSAETPDQAASLMAAIAATQDRDAFECLFAHFAPRVKAYMLKLGTEASLADELAQETLLTVWRKAGQFDRSKASPSTWIFTIARNLRIDAFRKMKRPELDPEDPALVPDAEEAADERIDRLERAGVIREALKDLNQEQAEVVRLSFFEDKSHSVIAEELGIPLGTVKSRLRLAFGRIRKVVGEVLE